MSAASHRFPLPRRLADLRTIALLTALSALYATLWFGGPWWLIFPTLLLAVTACAAKHNHTHCATFDSRAANRFLDLWITLLTGTSTTGIRVAHQTRHHGSNQSPEDFVRSSLVAGRSRAAALLLYVPLVIVRTWREGASDLGPERRASLWKSRMVEKAVLALFVVTGAAVSPLTFAAVFLPPWLFGQFFLILINLPQHDGCDPDAPWRHSRNVTGPISNWFLLNNGFHTIHHARPGAHWSDLPELHRREVARRDTGDLNHLSMASFWASWWRQRSRKPQVSSR